MLEALIDCHVFGENKYLTLMSQRTGTVFGSLLLLMGFVMFQGDLFDHQSLVKAIKQVDVVISTVGRALFSDQVKIIAAIKEAGNVKVYMS